MVKKLVLSLSIALGLSAVCAGFVHAGDLERGYFSRTVPAYMGTEQTDKRMRSDYEDYMTFQGKNVGTTINFAMINLDGDQRSNRKTYGAGATDLQYTGVYDIVKTQGYGLWYKLQLNASSSSRFSHTVSAYWSPNKCSGL